MINFETFMTQNIITNNTKSLPFRLTFQILLANYLFFSIHSMHSIHHVMHSHIHRVTHHSIVVHVVHIVHHNWMHLFHWDGYVLFYCNGVWNKFLLFLFFMFTITRNKNSIFLTIQIQIMTFLFETIQNNTLIDSNVALD